MVANSLELAPRYHAKILDDYKEMKKLPCDEKRGAEIIGRAHYDGVLKSNQAAIAWKDWNTPRHKEFKNRDWYSLFNCFTEGLKKGSPGKAVSSLTRCHEWFSDNLSEERKSMDELDLLRSSYWTGEPKALSVNN